MEGDAVLSMFRAKLTADYLRSPLPFHRYLGPYTCICEERFSYLEFSNITWRYESSYLPPWRRQISHYKSNVREHQTRRRSAVPTQN